MIRDEAISRAGNSAFPILHPLAQLVTHLNLRILLLSDLIMILVALDYDINFIASLDDFIVWQDR